MFKVLLVAVGRGNGKDKDPCARRDRSILFAYTFVIDLHCFTQVL